MAKPSMELAHFLAQCLTKEEFLACYSIAWIGQAYDALGVEQLTPMERDIAFSSLANELLFGFRALALAGYEFRNFHSDSGGMPKPKDSMVPCHGNLSYVAVLAMGQRFNYLGAVDALIDLIRSHNLNIDKHPIKQARAEIMESLEATRNQMTQEEAKAIIIERRKRMKTAQAILDSARVN